MAKVQIVVAVIGIVLALLAATLVSCNNIDECEREGHSYWYCYQLLYGHR